MSPNKAVNPSGGSGGCKKRKNTWPPPGYLGRSAHGGIVCGGILKAACRRNPRGGSASRHRSGSNLGLLPVPSRAETCTPCFIQHCVPLLRTTERVIRRRIPTDDQERRNGDPP